LRDTAAAAQSELADATKELARLSNEISTLTNQRAELDQARAKLSQTGEDQPAEAAPTLSSIEPGRYESGPVVAEFGKDNRFQLARSDGTQSVKGRYEVGDGMLNLSDVSGDIGLARFPMQCRLEAVDNGFRLQAANGSCQELAGTTFTR
jgi:hypothetical protein